VSGGGTFDKAAASVILESGRALFVGISWFETDEVGCTLNPKECCLCCLHTAGCHFAAGIVCVSFGLVIKLSFPETRSAQADVDDGRVGAFISDFRPI